MEPNKIQFKKSTQGTPYIEIGDLGKFIFSKITSHSEKGYKYMCFSHNYMDVISTKNTNGKRKTYSIPANNSYTVNMKLERESKNGSKKAVGLPHNTIPGRMKDFLKKTLKPLLDDEGYISYSKLDILKSKIDNKDISTILNEVQKKRKPKKKSKT